MSSRHFSDPVRHFFEARISAAKTVVFTVPAKPSPGLFGGRQKSR